MIAALLVGGLIVAGVIAVASDSTAGDVVAGICGLLAVFVLVIASAAQGAG